MFEVPGAKRVRRLELLSDSPRSSTSPPPSSDTRQEQYSKGRQLVLEFVDVGHDGHTQTLPFNAPLPQETQSSPAIRDVDNGPQAFEFRLFNTNTPSIVAAHDPSQIASSLHTQQPRVHRISIRSPTPLSGTGDGAFVVPFRPQSYYFANAADPGRMSAYSDVAVSGEQIREWAQTTTWPGTELPWRVIHLRNTKSSSSKHVSPSLTAAPADTKTRRTRAGKKQRLAIRKRYAARTANVETEREKRTRRNREKKVKKKEREKLKKRDGFKGKWDTSHR